MFLYIISLEGDAEENTGVGKKVLSQMKVFNNAFKKAYCCSFGNQIAYFKDAQGNVIENRIVPSRKDYWDVVIYWVKKYEIKYVYIRQVKVHRYYLVALKRLNEMKTKIVTEIPSYPYDNIKQDNLSRIEDQIYRKELKKYVDRITTYSSDKEIWNIKCINLVNGIDVNEIPFIYKGADRKIDRIVMSCISMAYPWHGYERIIKGLKNYFENGGNRNIELYITGEGSTINEYKLLVNQLELEDRVFFTGVIDGEELDRLYEHTEIAIGTLGFYKIGIYEASPIKIAEYCARGILTVIGCRDLRFNGDESFLYFVDNDETVLDVRNIIEFFDKSVIVDNNIKIRKYAEKNLSWDSIMRPVISYYLDK